MIPHYTKVDARPAFRADIESLRGVCVLAVIAFHFFQDALPSGFVGVDCFFAISGAVITLSMLRDHEMNVWAFFSRRFKRLAPASTVVSWATLITSSLLQRNPQRVATDVLFASLFSANFRFFSDSKDYFAAQMDPSPMLHFWSLSVEEQFYAVYGPLVVLLKCLPVSHRSRICLWVSVLSVCCVLSLAAAVGATFAGATSAAFYLTPFRLWQMAAGCLAAIAVHHEIKVPGTPASILLVVTLALTPSIAPYFPGLSAIPAVLATCAVVMSDEVPWLASNQPLRFAGRISYSLYLWHWPIVCLLPLSALQALVLCACLSAVTGLYIEPWGRKMSKRGVAIVLALCILTLPAAMMMQRSSGGDDFEHREGNVATGDDEVHAAIRRSLSLTKVDNLAPPFNMLSRDREPHPSGIIHILTGKNGVLFLAGDSHASQNVFWGVRTFARDRNMTMLLSFRSSCPFPATGYGRTGYTPPDAEGCRAYRMADMAFIRRTRPEIVITSNSAAGKIREIVEEYMALQRSLRSAGVRQFVAIEDNPRTKRHDHELMMGQQVVFTAKPAHPSPPKFYVRTRDLFCADDRCPLVIHNMITTGDGNHLTRTYATFLGHILADRIARVLHDQN